MFKKQSCKRKLAFIEKLVIHIRRSAIGFLFVVKDSFIQCRDVPSTTHYAALDVVWASDSPDRSFLYNIFPSKQSCEGVTEQAVCSGIDWLDTTRQTPINKSFHSPPVSMPMVGGWFQSSWAFACMFNTYCKPINSFHRKVIFQTFYKLFIWPYVCHTSSEFPTHSSLSHLRTIRRHHNFLKDLLKQLSSLLSKPSIFPSSP